MFLGSQFYFIEPKLEAEERSKEKGMKVWKRVEYESGEVKDMRA